MNTQIEVDLRWVLLFVSFLGTYILRDNAIGLSLFTGLFTLSVVVYIKVITKYLDGKAQRLHGQLVALLERHQDESAKDLIADQTALRLWGRKYVLDNALGLVEMSQMNHENAYIHFEQAAQGAPYNDRFGIELSLINVDIALDRTHAAIERCRRLLKQRPDSPVLREKLAELLIEDIDG
jgi:tetratricopeptide (TPR) repeat protein